MIARALFVAAWIGAPGLAAAQSPDVFEITFGPHAGQGVPAGPIRIEADALEVVQCCTITLRQGPDAVATLQHHQVALVVNRSAGGERAYDVYTQAGVTLQVRADRMVPNQNGLVYFYTGGRLVGVTNQNAALMVIDVGARVDGGVRTVRPPDPPVRYER